MAAMPQEDAYIRAIAGHLLKNNLPFILASTSNEAVEYVKSSVLQAFDTEAGIIRNAAGQAVTYLLREFGVLHWPECKTRLLCEFGFGSLNRQEVSVVRKNRRCWNPCQAAFRVFRDLCEHNPNIFDVDIGGENLALSVMIPQFFIFTDHPYSTIRSHAIACTSIILVAASPSKISREVDLFLDCLIRRTLDSDPAVRQHVCEALGLFLPHYPEKFTKNSLLSSYMLSSMTDENPLVVLFICELWLSLAQNKELVPCFKTLLPRLAPLLLDCLVDTEGVPVFYCDGEDRSEGDIDLETMMNSHEATVRTCAASVLEELAVLFRGDLLSVLLAPLREKLHSGNSILCESSVFALGLFAKGIWRFFLQRKRWTHLRYRNSWIPGTSFASAAAYFHHYVGWLPGV